MLSDAELAAFMNDPQQRQAEVIVAHRVGYWGGENIEACTAEEIAEADAYLEAHIQQRIAAVRADMQREVQAVEWGTAEIDKDGDLFDCWANPSRESAMKDLAGADKDVPMVLVQRTAAVPAGPWFLVAPSTPNQQGAEQ